MFILLVSIPVWIWADGAQNSWPNWRGPEQNGLSYGGDPPTEWSESIWSCAGLGTNPIPSPVYADGIVYVTSGYRSPVLLAIKLALAKGDITNTKAVVWSIHRDTP